jgi:uncharacterized protein YecE (DUF72 family)
MLFVACSGFPVPVSRYFGEFGAVEISDTEIGTPGEGTVRRWIREAPKGFGFSLLAPKGVGESGFERSHATREAVEGIGRLALRVGARAVVFAAPDTFRFAARRRGALAAFIEWLPANFPPVVLDLPGWKPEQVAAACQGRDVTVAYDPLTESPPPGGAGLAYLRLPGPAGHRSRYDDDAIGRLTPCCQEADAQFETVFCVFRNIDMHANATQLMSLLGPRAGA